MTIQVKNTGAYASIVGVSHKRTGVYEAVQGVFVKSGGAYEPVGGGATGASMALGMNVAWINSWAKAWVFSNFMYHADLTQATGTGIWTQDQGLITTTDQNDTFRFNMGGADELPTGSFTVLNPDALPVYVGGWTTGGGTVWRNDTEFTVDLPIEPGARCLHVKGNVTNVNGNLACVATDHLAKWKAGNIWHDDFIAFQQGMKCNPLRFMDWTVASDNIETNWSDRSVPTKPTLHTAGANGNCVPYEFMCDLASRLKTDIWVCVPPRATSDYVEQMAALFAAQMPAGRRVWLELGNEIWNLQDPWADGARWLEYLDHTRRTAVADVPGQKFVLVGHGLTNGAPIRSFATVENRAVRATDEWVLRMGVTTYAKALNANEFELYREAGLTNKVEIPQGQVNLLFVVTGEAGKTADMNAHYGEVSLRNWDIFDAAMGAGRLKHIIAAQSANPSTSAGRLAVPGVQARTDYVAIAPYFNGEWCGARLTAASGAITPGWWGAGSRTVHIGVYASGATPSIDDVIAGTGAVSKQAYSYTSGANTYSNATQVTGLTNGTDYDVHFVFADRGVNYRIVGTVAASAGGSTVYAYSSYADQLQRNQMDTISAGVNEVAGHQAVSGGVPVVCYEGGLHYSQGKPPEMATRLAGYQESPEFAEAIRHNLACIASTDCKMHAYYGDVLGTVFSIANSFTDTSDLRYGVFAGLKGKMPDLPRVNIASAVPDGVLTEPTYPFTVYTFPDASLTYRIIHGDDGPGNFVMVDAELLMVNGTGVNWSAPSGRILTIEASDGNTTDTATVSFALGDAWYPADAQFVWDSIADANSTQIDPVIGNVITRTAGDSDAMISGGLWDFTGCVYTNSTAQVGSAANWTTPALLAAVLDQDTLGWNWNSMLRAGDQNQFVFTWWDQAFTARMYTNPPNVGLNIKFTANGFPLSGKQVYWAYWDGVENFVAGVNQVDGESAVAIGTSGAAVSRRVQFGNDALGNTKTKIGSTVVLQRPGLTLAQAKAIVAKMQAHHGIT